MILGVLVDLDDTIFDFRAAEREAITAALSELGVNCTPAATKRYSEINAQLWKALERGEVDRARLKTLRFEQLFSELGVVRSAAEMRDVYEKKLSAACPLVEGAEEFLIKASARFRLYPITNGTTSVQRGRLAASGIARYFSGVYISEDIGYVKPDKRFFEYVLADAGLSRDETAVLGDSLTSDIAGGKACGIKTVLFDPSGTSRGGVTPDRTARTLDEALDILCSL